MVLEFCWVSSYVDSRRHFSVKLLWLYIKPVRSTWIQDPCAIHDAKPKVKLKEALKGECKLLKLQAYDWVDAWSSNCCFNMMHGAPQIFTQIGWIHGAQTLKVRVYMGYGWHFDFSPTHFDSYSPPDFYIKVSKINLQHSLNIIIFYLNLILIRDDAFFDNIMAIGHDF